MKIRRSIVKCLFKTKINSSNNRQKLTYPLLLTP